MNAINGINPSMVAGMGGFPRMGQAQALTDDQKAQLQEIIAQYDPESLTREDATSMMDQIQEAGIHPGEDMKNILEEAGFEVQTTQGGAPPKRMGGPPPTGMGGPRRNGRPIDGRTERLGGGRQRDIGYGAEFRGEGNGR